MQGVSRKQKKSAPRARLMALLAAVAVLCAGVGVYAWQATHAPEKEIESPDRYGEVLNYAAEDVRGIAITLRSGEQWGVQWNGERYVMADDEHFPMDESMLSLLLNAASIISYSDVLTQERSDYAQRLAEFGLDVPRAVVCITYADGQEATVHVGDKTRESGSSYHYMTVEGDDRLFALDQSTAEALTLERRLMHAVEQPVLHKARMDEITLITPQGTLQWRLAGSIKDADAADRWLLVSPYRYPADGAALENLRTTLENLRLGAYVDEATEENLARYGLDTPRLTVQVHMQAGSIGVVGESGVYDVRDWEEGSFTLHVGNPCSEVTDYVQVGDSIYLENHFTMGTLMDMKAVSTLTTYPVLTSLSNLASLTVQTAEGETVYRLSRTVVTDEEGEMLPDEDGGAIAQTVVTRNGEPVSFDAFEASYQRLMMATVSGELPEGWTQQEEAHTLYTFATLTGVTHTIALTRFDTLHDAVVVDGCARFYIIRGGLDFGMEDAAMSGAETEGNM